MFKTNKNLRRNMKHKQQKSTKKNSQYVEDYNEVILNDLVSENKEDDKVDVQEEPTRKNKRKRRLNFGNSKKSTSSEELNKKEKPLNKKHKMEKGQPQEIVDVDEKKNTQQVEEENSPKINKKEKKHSKKSSKNKLNDDANKENPKKSSKKSSKKPSKKHSEPSKEEKSKKPSKHSAKKEEIKTKSISNEDMEVETIEEVEVEDTDDIVESSIFRSADEGDQNENSQFYEEDNINENKLEDIIWSDDKFPKV